MASTGRNARAGALLRELAEFIATTLVARWCYAQEIASTVGCAVADAVVMHWGGVQLRLPKTLVLTDSPSDEHTGAQAMQHRFLRDLRALISERLIEHAAAPEKQALEIGREVVIAFLGTWGNGGQFYIPRVLHHRRVERDEEIMQRLARENACDLAIEYHLSSIRIYQIANEQRKKAAARLESAADAARAEPLEKPAEQRPAREVVSRDTDFPAPSPRWRAREVVFN